MTLAQRRLVWVEKYLLPTFAVILAGFLLLSMVLGVLARVLPQMNVLTESFPLRVALGLLLASMTLPSLERFGVELGGWLSQFLIQ